MTVEPRDEPDGVPSDDISDVERELPWVAVLPEDDRRMFAEDMSRLFAEAAETFDLAKVQQTLREWRVTSEVYSDPELARRLSGPLVVTHGGRVPKPVVPLSDDISTGDDINAWDEISDDERELPWVAVLPEDDRRMFAEEMSQLFAEAAESVDLAAVEQALSEWRVTGEIYSDPELVKLLVIPRSAHGELEPSPIV